MYSLDNEVHIFFKCLSPEGNQMGQIIKAVRFFAQWIFKQVCFLNKTGKQAIVAWIRNSQFKRLKKAAY